MIDRLKQLQMQKETARARVIEAKQALKQLGVPASQIDKYWPRIDNYSNHLKAAVDAYIEAKSNLDALQ